MVDGTFTGTHGMRQTFFTAQCHLWSCNVSISGGRCSGYETQLLLRWPFFATTSLQMFRRSDVNFFATDFAFADEQMALARALYLSFDNTGRLLLKSAKSFDRSCLRSQPQNFSTGFKSGLDGGTCHTFKFWDACATLLAFVCKKGSPSHRHVQGPGLPTGSNDAMAVLSRPASTAFTHSVVLIFLFL